jgi:hypothetical protein
MDQHVFSADASKVAERTMESIMNFEEGEWCNHCRRMMNRLIVRNKREFFESLGDGSHIRHLAKLILMVLDVTGHVDKTNEASTIGTDAYTAFTRANIVYPELAKSSNLLKLTLIARQTNWRRCFVHLSHIQRFNDMV